MIALNKIAKENQNRYVFRFLETDLQQSDPLKLACGHLNGSINYPLNNEQRTKAKQLFDHTFFIWYTKDCDGDVW